MLAFWRQGYAATSIDDLARATGASRASLYAHFGDKRALLIRSLGLYAERFAERVTAALAAAPSARGALRLVLDGSADRLASTEGPPGCLRTRATLELRGQDPALDAAIDASNEAYLRHLERIVATGVERGELTPEDADGLALFLAATVSGLVVTAEGGASRQALGTVVRRAVAAWPEP